MARTANAKLAVSRHSLAEDARTPLYSQIFSALCATRFSAASTPTARSCRASSRSRAPFDVSRITAKRALNELAEAGLAVRQKGRGTRVRNKGGGTIVSGSLQSLVDSLRANARNQSVRVAGFAYVSAPADVASALRLTPEASVQRAERICSADGAPYSHLVTYIPAEIGAQWTAEELERSGMMSQLERVGVPLDFAEQVITATLADAELAGRARRPDRQRADPRRPHLVRRGRRPDRVPDRALRAEPLPIHHDADERGRVTPVDYKYISADNHCDSWWIPEEPFPGAPAGEAPRDRSARRSTAPTAASGSGKASGGASRPTARATRCCSSASIRTSTSRPGALPPTTPAILLEHMDLARIYVRRSSSATRASGRSPIRELNMAVTQAYNDFVMELNAAALER